MNKYENSNKYLNILQSINKQNKIDWQMQAPPITQHQMQQVLEWMQTMTFSRSPKNLPRDFSDGVLMAEIMRHQFPSLVQLHNYQPANSSAAKYVNWKMLNEKVFRKIGFQIARADIEGLVAANSGVIQRVLHMVYIKILGRAQTQNQTVSLTNKLSQMSNLNMSLSRLKKSQSQQKQQQNRSQFAKQLSTQLAQKQGVIQQLRETIQILQTKMKKMQQLSKLKDAKIDSLMRKLDERIGL